MFDWTNTLCALINYLNHKYIHSRVVIRFTMYFLTSVFVQPIDFAVRLFTFDSYEVFCRIQDASFIPPHPRVKPASIPSRFVDEFKFI